MPGRIILTITAGPKVGGSFVFDEHDTLLLGRVDDAHIHLPYDIQVSRNHFLLEVSPPQARIRDLGSLNGTYINGRKCGGRNESETPSEGARHQYPEVDLHDGDEIKVGETILKVHIEAAPRGKPTPVFELEPPTPQPQPRATANIHDYHKERQLGAGGMGEVYLMRHKKDGTLAALKMMHSQVIVDDAVKREFMREIASTCALQHKHIVTFLGSGVDDRSFYFFLEYCEGGSVEDLRKARGGKISLEEATPIMLESLKGLAYIHECDFVHRDLKPQNLLLRGTQHAWTTKIADLGLAKSFVSAGFSGMTVTGAYSGTLPFMPREQVVEFRYVKPASDVWAIAATFYFMLTGRFPRKHVPGQDPIDVILNGRITPIQTDAPSLPDPVVRVINRALLNAHKDRYQNAGEMLQALEKALQ